MKKMNRKGFTLAELLIVVAIIAMLVAIAVPIFNTQLEKSREAVDVSNMRAAYAIAATDAITMDFDSYTKSGDVYTGYYDPATSTIKKTVTACIKAQVDGLQSGTLDWPDNATFTYSGDKSATNGIKVEIDTSDDYKITVSDAA